MEHNPQDNRYEQLYEELRTRVEWLHNRNKIFVKYGSIGLIVLPIVLFLVRWLTGSDKVVFLLFWVIGVFAISFFLIGVEYFDDVMQKTLRKMTDREAEFDDLLQPPPELRGKISRRIAGLQGRDDIREHMKMYGVEAEKSEAPGGEDGDVDA